MRVPLCVQKCLESSHAIDAQKPITSKTLALNAPAGMDRSTAMSANNLGDTDIVGMLYCCSTAGRKSVRAFAHQIALRLAAR